MRLIHALGEFVALASVVLVLALLRIMLPQAAVERQRRTQREYPLN
jgi:hypothetical protein